MRLDRSASRLRFVYPFTFHGENFDRRVESFSSVKQNIGGIEEAMWEGDSFPAEDLVAHIADYLNTGDLVGQEMAALFRLSAAVQAHTDGVGSDGVWSLQWRRKTIRFSIDTIELAIFRAGVGFLTFAIRPHGANVDDWLDFSHAFRFARGRRSPRLIRERRVGFDQTIRADSGGGKLGARGVHPGTAACLQCAVRRRS